MPGKTIPHILILFMLWSSFVFVQAQPVPGSCAFDRQHRRKLTTDATYQRQQQAVEQYLLRRAQSKLNAPADERSGEHSIYTIPVVVHIFYTPGTAQGRRGGPSADQVRHTIDQLNDGFRNRGSYKGGPRYTDAGIEGADVGITFRLAAYDPEGMPSDGIRSYATSLAGQPIDQEINGVPVLDSLRRLSAWPTSRYLNIYVLPSLCNKEGNCPVGFSYQAAAHGLDYDGVYVISKAMQSDEQILIHEAGHYFNLYHTFESGCAEADCLTGGDRVCDTPPDCYPTNCGGWIPNCLLEERQNTCHRDADIANSPFTRDVEDIYENFMDYGYWKCFNSFTPGQRKRMRDALLGFRSSLLAPMVQTEPDTCRFNSIQVLSMPECLSPGDTGTALLRIEYRHPPDSGRLIVNDRPFDYGDSSLILPVSFSADAGYTPVEAYFSADTSCRMVADSLLFSPLCPPTAAQRCDMATLELSVASTAYCRENLIVDWEAPLDTTGWPAPCSPYEGREKWFFLVVPNTGSVELEAQAGIETGLGLAIFEHCEEGPIKCRTATAGDAARLILTGLVPGDTLLGAVWPNSIVNGDAVSLCAYLPFPAPANDHCSQAELLPVSDSRLGQTCTESREVNFTGAALSGGLEACAPPAGGDVWYDLVVPAEGEVAVKILGSGAAQTTVAAYSSCSGDLLGCSSLSNRGRPELLLRSLSPGDTLKIRAYPKEIPEGPVRLCASVLPQRPPNDDCTLATLLPIQSHDEEPAGRVIYNVAVTSSGQRPACQDIPVEELWFQVIVPPSGAVKIGAEGVAGILSPGLAAYQGCGGAELACAPSDGDRADLLLTGLSPGDTLRIALWDFFQFRFGSVRIYATLLPPPSNNICSGATLLPVCHDSACTPLMINGLRRATSLAGLSSTDCPQQSRGALWYQLAAPDSGRLLLEVFPDSDAVTGMAVYSSCDGAPIDCRSNTSASSGPLQLLLTDLSPGDSLLLSVWSIADSAGIRAFAPDCSEMRATLAVSPITCNGQSNGTAAVLPADTTRYTYRWNNGEQRSRIDQLTAGDYRVTITNRYECRDTLSFSLEMPPPLQAYAESSPSPTDTTLGSIRVFAEGGTPPYSYKLENSSPQDDPLFEHLSPGNYRYWVLDGNGCLWNDTATVDLSTSNNRIKALSIFRVYPNPVKDHLNIEIQLQHSSAGRLELLDPLGRRIRQQRFSNDRQLQIQWPVFRLSGGIYWLRLSVQGWIWTRKVIIE